MSRELATPRDRDRRLNEVLLGYVEAAQAGRAPDRQELLDLHPDLAAELRDFFASRDQLERLTGALPPQADGAAERPAGPPELGRLGDFRILREIGRGGMGVVYEAEQISLQRRVALKVLPFAAAIDPRQLQRFRIEAQAAAQLHHTSIVPVFAVGSERGVHYYAMQFIDGQSLATLIAQLRKLAAMRPGARPDPTPSFHPPTRGSSWWVPSGWRNGEPTGPLDGPASPAPPAEAATTSQAAATFSTERSSRSRAFFERVASLGKQAADALEHAHQMGVVHRDVKPANLLLDQRGQLWVTDFGLAQFRTDLGLTLTGELLGTLRYTSPEQALAKRGLVDHRSDIYSLGATLYELLTLRPIFDGRDRHELLRQIAFEEPRPPRAIDRAVPLELETVVLKALAKIPTERYATAQELADDLTRFLEDKPVLARRPSPAQKAKQWARRHRAVVVSAGVVLALAVVGLGACTYVIARAYDRERVKVVEAQNQRVEAEKQRELAQQNFRRARDAVELLTRISEEELADRHSLGALRQRVLEAALDYYQDFLQMSGGDASLRKELDEDRERVTKMMSRLAALQGAGQFLWLRQPDVKAELGLTKPQRDGLGKLEETYRGYRQALAREVGRLRPRERHERFLTLAQRQDEEVERILTPAQAQRLQQVALQYRGPFAFLDPAVAKSLGLTDEQNRKMLAIQAEAHFAGVENFALYMEPDEVTQKTREAWATACRRLIDVLTPAQAKKWAQMQGPPFHGSWSPSPRSRPSQSRRPAAGPRASAAAT